MRIGIGLGFVVGVAVVLMMLGGYVSLPHSSGSVGRIASPSISAEPSTNSNPAPRGFGPASMDYAYWGRAFSSLGEALTYSGLKKGFQAPAGLPGDLRLAGILARSGGVALLYTGGDVVPAAYYNGSPISLVVLVSEGSPVKPGPRCQGYTVTYRDENMIKGYRTQDVVVSENGSTTTRSLTVYCWASPLKTLSIKSVEAWGWNPLPQYNVPGRIVLGYNGLTIIIQAYLPLNQLAEAAQQILQ